MNININTKPVACLLLNAEFENQYGELCEETVGMYDYLNSEALLQIYDENGMPQGLLEIISMDKDNAIRLTKVRYENARENRKNA